MSTNPKKQVINCCNATDKWDVGEWWGGESTCYMYFDTETNRLYHGDYIDHGGVPMEVHDGTVLRWDVSSLLSPADAAEIIIKVMAKNPDGDIKYLVGEALDKVSQELQASARESFEEDAEDCITSIICDIDGFLKLKGICKLTKEILHDVREQIAGLPGVLDVHMIVREFDDDDC